MPDVHAVIGRLAIVHAGQAITVTSLKTGAEQMLYVQDPEPFRGKEGDIVCASFDEGIVTVPEL